MDRKKVRRFLGLVVLAMALVLLCLVVGQVVRHWTRPKQIRARVTEVEPVLSVAFSPDGQCVAVGTSSNDAQIIEVSELSVIRTLRGHETPVYAVAFSPDGTMLATGSEDNSVRLWDLSEGTTVSWLTGHQGRVTSVAFSPDGALLATGSADNSVRLWDVRAGAALRTLSGHDRGVTAVAFSPDGAYLASGSSDGLVKLWRAKTGDEVASLSARQDDAARPSWADNYSHTVQSLAFSPDGTVLASGGLHLYWTPQCGTPPRPVGGDLSLGQVSLWSVPRGAVIRTLGWNGGMGHIDDVTALAFSPDGRFLASGSGDKAITVWDVKASTEVFTWKAHDLAIRAIAWSPDGETLVSGAEDGKLKLWHMREVLGR